MAKPRNGEMRYGIKGWGRYLGEMEDPKTIDEAKLTALLAIADRLADLNAHLLDVKIRLSRMEMWLEETAPGYRPAYTRALAAASARDKEPSP